MNKYHTLSHLYLIAQQPLVLGYSSDLIKTKAKGSKKEISKEEAEKILKEHQKQDHNHEHDHEHDHDHDHDHPEEKKALKPVKIEKKLEPSASTKPSA